MAGKSLQEILEKLQAERQSELIKQNQIQQEIFNQREKQRQEYLRRIRMYEKTSFNSTTTSSSSAGGSIQTTTEVETIYWALLFSVDSISGQNYVAQSIDKDSSGNIYIASIDESNAQKSIVRKLSSSGDVLWEKTFFNSGSDADMEVSRILAVSDGLIVLYKGGVRKLDTSGNLQWSFLQNITTSPLVLTSCCLNLSGDSIYVFGVSDASSFEIFQLDLSTGSISFNKAITVLSPGLYKSDCDIVIDSLGNIVLALSYGDGITYNTTLLKIDPLNAIPGIYVIYEWAILASSYDNYSQRVSSLSIAQNDEIVVHGSSRGITKVASDMSGASAVFLDIIFGSEAWDSKASAVSSNGDIFVIGEYGPKLKVVKLSSSLLPQFSYTIESLIATLTIEGYYSSEAISSIEIVDDIMFITAKANSQELILKLPLTNMSGYPETSEATWGTFVFQNSPIIQSYLSITTQATDLVNDDSTYLSNDLTLSTGFSSPSNSQTTTQTSFD